MSTLKYQYELENCRKEIQSMLNEFIYTPINELTHFLIKIRTQQIIDNYIYECKIPNFITENDFKIEVNNHEKKL